MHRHALNPRQANNPPPILRNNQQVTIVANQGCPQGQPISPPQIQQPQQHQGPNVLPVNQPVAAQEGANIDQGRRQEAENQLCQSRKMRMVNVLMNIEQIGGP